MEDAANRIIGPELKLLKMRDLRFNERCCDVPHVSTCISHCEYNDIFKLNFLFLIESKVHILLCVISRPIQLTDTFIEVFTVTTCHFSSSFTTRRHLLS